MQAGRRLAVDWRKRTAGAPGSEKEKEKGLERWTKDAAPSAISRRRAAPVYWRIVSL